MKNKHHNIYRHYEKCFEKYGDTHKGVDWPNKHDTIIRYEVMSDLFIHETFPSVLDFGCGLGHFFEFIETRNINMIYKGVDISDKFIKHCKNKFSNVLFEKIDIMNQDIDESFDYIICNGVFTEKLDLSQNEMNEFVFFILKKLWNSTKKGLAVNFISKNVDYERDDLNHMSLDVITDFICKNLSRNFIIRNDYGLYEYTVYIKC